MGPFETLNDFLEAIRKFNQAIDLAVAQAEQQARIAALVYGPDSALVHVTTKALRSKEPALWTPTNIPPRPPCWLTSKQTGWPPTPGPTTSNTR